jgi:hypothetical protein
VPVPEQVQEQPPATGQRPVVTRRALLVAVVVVGLVIAAGLVVLGARLAGGGPDGGPGGDPDRTVSGALDGREQATFVLLDGATSVSVRIRDLGDQLYQVQTPEGGAQVPVATAVDDEVRVELADTAEDGASAVEVQLSSAVRWQIRILGGASEQRIDLCNGQISSVEIAGGANRIELTLPPPQGTTTVRMSGGASQWRVHQIGAAPVRVRVSGGAGSVTIEGVPDNGVGAGTVFDPPGWDDAQQRVDIDAVAGMSSFVLDRLAEDLDCA